MFRNLIAFPLLALVVIVQSAVISNITLLSGYADIMLVVLAAWSLKSEAHTAWLWAILGGGMVAFVSGIPWPIVIVGYLFVVYLSNLLRNRIWQAPLLALISVTFLGSLVMNLFVLVSLNLLGRPLPFGESIGLVILPSILLNLLFAVPVYVIIRDLAKWVNQLPEKE
ncbi:MAG: hypothetical protein QGM50_09735 [Anaerolineae bacterium]|nr:hypothetical protein [Anaerolineae bacterium]MDK1119053.1 hypothetical protein [Anaerolineae bacterium]